MARAHLPHGSEEASHPKFWVGTPPRPCHFVPYESQVLPHDPRKHAGLGVHGDLVARRGTTVHERLFESTGGHHEHGETRGLGSVA